MISEDILLVHPHPGFADLCGKWLKEDGCRVEVAYDASAVLAFLQTKVFNLAVVSHAPPEVDGLDILRSISERGADVPVLLLAEQRQLPVSTIAEAVQLGAIGFMERPSKPEALVEGVAAALGQKHRGLVPSGAPSPSPAPEAEASYPATAPRNPTFDLDGETRSRLDDRLNKLYQSVQVRCILLTDRSGRLLYLQGDIDRSRALSLAVLIAGSFSAAREIAEIIGTEKDRRLQSLQEGISFSLYSAQARKNWVLAVAFEPEETILGLVRQYTLQAATDLSKIASKATAAPEQREEIMGATDDLFHRRVGEALEDLFD